MENISNKINYNVGSKIYNDMGLRIMISVWNNVNNIICKGINNRIWFNAYTRIIKQS